LNRILDIGKPAIVRARLKVLPLNNVNLHVKQAAIAY